MMPATLTAEKANPRSPTIGELASIELFAGGGGMALGLHNAGFRHVAVNELDRRALETLEANFGRDRQEGDQWPLVAGDVKDQSWGDFADRVALCAGGAPCQPFSLGGVHRGHRDDRNLWPPFIDVVRRVRPKAVLGENVRGLTRPAFLPYLDYICDWLSVPHVVPRENETWFDHHARIRRVKQASNTPPDEHYLVDRKVLCAADYGVPQLRYRLFIVAFRADQVDTWNEGLPFGKRWSWPVSTHSQEKLLWTLSEGSYWEAHGLAGHQVDIPRSKRKAVFQAGMEEETLPWRTLRDALVGRLDGEPFSPLPEPLDGVDAPGFTHHVGVPGARLYKGHSGNALDWPAKTIKAGVHGVPGGEHVIRFGDGRLRYMSVRECARIQTFPDWWVFRGPRSEASRQIGNAVPVRLARIMGEHVAATLRESAPAQAPAEAEGSEGDVPDHVVGQRARYSPRAQSSSGSAR